MNKSSKIITFSETSKNRLVNYGYSQDKIEVIYHYHFESTAGGNCPRKGKDANKRILFVGSLIRHKGLHIIIAAMKDVVKEIPNSKLLVVGKGRGKFVDSINRLINECSLCDYVDFLGHRDNDFVLDLIKDVDLVVVPEQWYSEFGPVILIESKLLHKQIVASRIGSIPEFVRDGIDGILVDFDNAHAFAKGMVSLLKSSDSSGRIADGISDAIKKISISDDVFDSLEKVYLSSLKENN
jgi:1,4-alpha-glucan branching enzyme